MSESEEVCKKGGKQAKRNGAGLVFTSTTRSVVYYETFLSGISLLIRSILYRSDPT